MDIEKIISEMTLEEKCSMLSGEDFWHTQTLERLGIKHVMVSDGPNGLRKQDIDNEEASFNTSIKSTCMPSACATAASFDRELLYREGEMLGNTCNDEGVGVLLGPAMNIKRSPLCGRNFEYYSEDPYLSGELASSLIRGVQSKGVAACAKHFAANNQEFRRFTSDSQMDDRTLREIYLPAFEASVKKGKVMTMMCGYNRINGVHCAANKYLLTDILRDEWKFDGYVMTDWGAIDIRVDDARAGLDLQMPGTGGEDDRLVVEAVRRGELDESIVDECVRRILSVNERISVIADRKNPRDMETEHEFSGRIAEQCMVLLKNRDNVLPLDTRDDICVVGEFAVHPRFQGGGSSHVNCYKVTSLMDVLKNNDRVNYVQGYSINHEEIDEKLAAAAVEAAKSAGKVIILAGLPDSYECESYDRKHLRIPAGQAELIGRLAKVNPNLIVVLLNGSPVEMPWLSDVKAVIEAYLGGENMGEALRKILYGEVNPSGRLPETFPLKIEDTPSYLTYGLPKDAVSYDEGVFVGYRWYEKRKMDVLFPFGYGLSYTSFDYSALCVSMEQMTEDDMLRVSVDVTNTGDRAGAEVVQLYVAPRTSRVMRPIREMKGFEKVFLAPGEKKTVEFELERRAFAYWDTVSGNWTVDTGIYDIEICKNASEVLLSKPVSVTATRPIGGKVTLNSTYMDLIRYTNLTPRMKEFLEFMRKTLLWQQDETSQEAITPMMIRSQMEYSPLRNLVTLGSCTVTYDEILSVIDEMNAAQGL